MKTRGNANGIPDSSSKMNCSGSGSLVGTAPGMIIAGLSQFDGGEVDFFVVDRGRLIVRLDRDVITNRCSV